MPSSGTVLITIIPPCTLGTFLSKSNGFTCVTQGVYRNSTTKLQEWIPRIERRKNYLTTWVRKCIITELSELEFTECAPTPPNCRNKIRDTGYNCYTSNQVTSYTRDFSFFFFRISHFYYTICTSTLSIMLHNYRVIRPFSKLSVIPAIRTRSDNSVTLHFRTHVVIPFLRLPETSADFSGTANPHIPEQECFWGFSGCFFHTAPFHYRIIALLCIQYVYHWPINIQKGSGTRAVECQCDRNNGKTLRPTSSNSLHGIILCRLPSTNAVIYVVSIVINIVNLVDLAHNKRLRRHLENDLPYQIPGVIDVFVVLVFKVQFVSLIPRNHKRIWTY
jgi:hypothetical protein